MKCSQEIIGEIVAHARREVPGECCGVLIGHATAIVEAIPARNLSDNQNRFLVDPQAHMAALRRSRGLGLEVVGFYHSHPHSAAVPSARDLDEAAYPELLMMIVSVQSVEPDVRLYRTSRVEGDRFEAVELVTDATDRNPESRPAGA